MRRHYEQQDAQGPWDGVATGLVERVVPWSALGADPGPAFASLDNAGHDIVISESGLYLVSVHAELTLGWTWGGDPPVGDWEVGVVLMTPQIDHT